MIKLIGRFLCWLGLHDWRHWNRNYAEDGRIFDDEVCGRDICREHRYRLVGKKEDWRR